MKPDEDDNFQKLKNSGLSTYDAFLRLECILNSFIKGNDCEIKKYEYYKNILLFLLLGKYWPINIIGIISQFIGIVIILFIYLNVNTSHRIGYIISFFIILAIFTLTLIMFPYYYYKVSTNVKEKIKNILFTISMLKKELKHLTYPCTFCEPIESISMVHTIRDGTLVYVPINLIVHDDILMLNKMEINHKNIDFNIQMIKNTESQSIHLKEKKTNINDKSSDVVANTKQNFYKVINPPIVSFLESLNRNNSYFPQFFCDQEIKSYVHLESIFKYLLLGVTFILVILSIFYKNKSIYNYRLFLLEEYICMIIFLLFPILTPLLWLIGIISASSFIRIIFDKNELNKKLSITDNIKLIYHLLKNQFHLIIFQPNFIQALCSITAIFCCEKEGILSYCSPTPTEISFLSHKNSSDVVLNPQDTNEHDNDNSLSKNSSFQTSLVRLEVDIDKIYYTDNKLMMCERWKRYLSNLKPIALSTSICGVCAFPVFRSFCSSVLSESSNKFEISSTCLCWLNVLFRYKETLSSRFQKINHILCIREKNFVNSQNLNNIHSCSQVVSVLVKNLSTNDYMIFTKGSTNYLLDMCSTYWDGESIKTLKEEDRNEILIESTKLNLDGRCVSFSFKYISEKALAAQNGNLKYIKYRIEQYMSDLSENPLKYKTSMYELPESFTTHSGYPNADLSIYSIMRGLKPISSDDKSNINLNHQSFYGTIFFSENPINNCVNFIEYLYTVGIRFIYFSAEGQLRSRAFAKKLGLDCGWNSYISLRHTKDIFISTNESRYYSTDKSQCVIQDSNQAKLPTGIENIRSHLVNVDDVPLHVPLFTDCDVESIAEMIRIMQENNEFVCIIGSCYNYYSLPLHDVADISIQVVPNLHQACLMNTIHSDGINIDYSQSPKQLQSSQLNKCPSLNSTIMQLSSSVNSIKSIFVFMPDSWDRIELAITESRKLMRNMKVSLFFFIICHIIIIFTLFSCVALLTPIPFTFSQVLLLSAWKIPLLSISHIFNLSDTWSFNAVPRKKNSTNTDHKVIASIIIILIIIPTALVSSLGINNFIFYSYCKITNETSSCNYLHYNSMNMDIWKRNRETFDSALMLSQKVVPSSISLFILVISACSLNVASQFNRNFITRWWAATVIIYLLTELVNIFCPSNDFIFNNLSIRKNPKVFWVTSIIFGWMLALFGIFELIKYYFIEDYHRQLKRERLKFETKLGLNSPV